MPAGGGAEASPAEEVGATRGYPPMDAARRANFATAARLAHEEVGATRGYAPRDAARRATFAIDARCPTAPPQTDAGWAIGTRNPPTKLSPSPIVVGVSVSTTTAGTPTASARCAHTDAMTFVPPS